MTLENNIEGKTIEIESPAIFKEDKLHSSGYITQIGNDLQELDYFEEYVYEPMEIYFYGKKYQLNN